MRMQDTISGLASINKSFLPGRLKLWCLQFDLLPPLKWPLTRETGEIGEIGEVHQLQVL